MGVVEMSRLLLLSGGMDSVALAWHLRPELSLTIDYGQRPAEGEIRAAQAICEELHLRHKVLHIDCGTLGSGDLADKAALPVAPMPEWWPYRNQLLLTFAAGVAINEGTQHVVFGAVASDRSHADGRMEFFDAMNHVLSIQEGAVVVETPAILESTVELCQRVRVPHTILAWSHSCHVGSFACGVCRGCHKHRESMRELGYGEY